MGRPLGPPRGLSFETLKSRLHHRGECLCSVSWTSPVFSSLCTWPVTGPHVFMYGFVAVALFSVFVSGIVESVVFLKADLYSLWCSKCSGLWGNPLA